MACERNVDACKCSLSFKFALLFYLHKKTLRVGTQKLPFVKLFLTNFWQRIKKAESHCSWSTSNCELPTCQQTNYEKRLA